MAGCSSRTAAPRPTRPPIKLVRKHAGPDRTYVVAADKSFHGRTMGSLALTGKPSIREPFGPYGADVVFVPYGDAEALAAAVTDRDRCAVPRADARRRRRHRSARRLPAGRTRDLHGDRRASSCSTRSSRASAAPARGSCTRPKESGPMSSPSRKGSAADCRSGSALRWVSSARCSRKGDHGSTFGGNPIACAAALAVIDTIEREDLLAHVSEGRRLISPTGCAAVEHPALVGVRGLGLWLALELAEPIAPAVEKRKQSRGFLVNAVQPDAIRIAPPLILIDRRGRPVRGCAASDSRRCRAAS